MAKKLPKLEVAFDRKNWEWMQDYDEEIALALEAEIADGATPEDVRRFIIRNIGSERGGMSERAESAARHLGRMKK